MPTIKDKKKLMGWIKQSASCKNCINYKLEVQIYSCKPYYHGIGFDDIRTTKEKKTEECIFGKFAVKPNQWCKHHVFNLTRRK